MSSASPKASRSAVAKQLLTEASQLEAPATNGINFGQRVIIVAILDIMSCRCQVLQLANDRQLEQEGEER